MNKARLLYLGVVVAALAVAVALAIAPSVAAAGRGPPCFPHGHRCGGF